MMCKRQTKPQKYILHTSRSRAYYTYENIHTLVWKSQTQVTKMQTSHLRVVYTCVKFHTISLIQTRNNHMWEIFCSDSSQPDIYIYIYSYENRDNKKKQRQSHLGYILHPGCHSPAPSYPLYWSLRTIQSRFSQQISLEPN